jgi:hypothetical protein
MFEVIFGVFQSPEVREKISETNQISILDFQCVAINIERLIKDLYFIPCS